MLNICINYNMKRISVEKSSSRKLVASLLAIFFNVLWIIFR